MNDQNKTSGLAIASLCCGAVCFIINPLYLVTIAAVILGIVALCMPGRKGLAVIGICLGVVGVILQIVLDVALTILTCGVGAISILI